MTPFLISSQYTSIKQLFLCSYMPLFLLKTRLDQCKVTMGTLEKKLEEEKQRVKAAESQRGTGTGKH